MSSRYRSESTAEPVDVIVVGAGVAGLSAAVEAASTGAKVTVLESAASPGGASAMSGAACCIVGTPLQHARGIDDTPELALADWSKMGGPTADLEWAGRYLRDSCREVYEFCAGLGIEWVDVQQPEGNSVPRWHIPVGAGRAIIDALLARARRVGAQVLCDAPVTDLMRNDGAVHGVVTPSGGVPRLLPAASVVVAAGGFAGNLDMVLEAAPHLRALPRLLSGSAPTSVGHGRQLLRGAGAQFANIDHLWVYPNGTPDPADPTGRRGLGVRGVRGEIWLNSHGNRFHNEALRGGHSGTRALLAQPGQTAWSVFTDAELDDVLLIDNEHWGTPAGPRPQAMAEFWRGSAYVRRADRPDGLAREMGLPEKAVVAALAGIDSALAAGLEYEPGFRRPLDGVLPLSGPGLVAIQFFPLAQKNFGGVRTDHACRVLDGGGAPIPGLYAAGEVAGMAGGGINGRSALEGTMFGPSLYSGRIAGVAAAAV